MRVRWVGRFAIANDRFLLKLSASNVVTKKAVQLRHQARKVAFPIGRVYSETFSMILQRSTINGYYHRKSVQDYAEYGSLFKISNINTCFAGEKKETGF